MTLWHLQFYRVSPDGSRSGGDKLTHAADTIDVACDQAEHLMQTTTFPFGKANCCVVKSQDGTIAREVAGRSDAASG
jgi:hypothetical protein